MDGRSGQHDRTIKTRRWRPLVAARAPPSPRERAEGSVSLDQGRDLPADSGGGLRHCQRQRCLALGEPALARIPKAGADQARQLPPAAIRMMVWNQASADAIRTAEALIKLEAREARLLGRASGRRRRVLIALWCWRSRLAFRAARPASCGRHRVLLAP